MYKPTLLFLVLLFVLSNLHAQYKGTVYSSDTTSLQGFINFEITKWGLNSIDFYTARESKRKTIDASQIFGFEYRMSDDPNTKYVYKSVNLSKTARDNYVFMRVLYDGEFKILQREKGFSSEYFVLGDNHELIKLVKKNQQFREVLSKYATKCYSSDVFIKKTSLKTNSLIKFGRLYEQCPDESEHNIPLPIRLSGGYLTNTLNLKGGSYIPDDAGSDSYSSGFVPFIGIGFEVPLSHNLSIVTDFNYYQKAYYKSFFNDNVINEVTINQKTVELPVSLKFRTSKTAFPLYISAGPSLKYHFKNEFGIHTTEFDLERGSITNNYDYLSLLQDIEMGIYISAGFVFTISDLMDSGVSAFFLSSVLGDKKVYSTPGWYSSTFGITFRLYYHGK